jgi:hypothetical protein
MEQPDAPAQDSEVATAAPEPTTEQHEVIDTDAPEELQEQQPEGEEEVDYEGEKYKLPKKLKDALLRQADYTRKTQELAAHKAAVEQAKAEVQQQAQFHREFLEELTEARSIAYQLEQFKQINWDALDETDPVQARRLERQQRALQDRQAELSRKVSEKGQQKALQEQQVTAKQLQEGAEVLKRDIKDWSPAKAATLTEFAVQYGFQKEQVTQVTNPLFVKLLNDAHTLAQLRKQAVTKPKPEAQEAPVTRITASKAVANKDPDKMSIAEWTKWREAQIKRSR